jgi:hypothetical protein
LSEWLPAVFNEAVFLGASIAAEKTFSRINAGESMTLPGRFIPSKSFPAQSHERRLIQPAIFARAAVNSSGLVLARLRPELSKAERGSTLGVR